MRLIRRCVFDFLHFIRFEWFLFNRNKKTIILCFHRINPLPSPGYPALKPELFEKMVCYLKARFDFVDFVDSHKKTNRRKIIVTFDDAYADFYEFAFPILLKHNIPCTLNVIGSCALDGLPHWTQKISDLMSEFYIKKIIPKNLEKDMFFSKNAEEMALIAYHQLKSKNLLDINNSLNIWENQLLFNKHNYTKMLSFSELNEILHSTQLVKIGNHTMNHINLKYSCDPKLIRDEIIMANRLIEESLDIKIDRFAFPNGEYNALCAEVLNELKFDYIQLTEIKQQPEMKNTFYRTEPYFNYFSENILKISGFHKLFKRS